MLSKFENVFTNIEIKDDQLPEFPMDFVAPGKNPPSVYYYKDLTDVVWSKQNLPIGIHKGGDYILVPLSIENKYKNDVQYGQALFCAAYDRNIIVYDQYCEAQKVSKRLVAILSQVMRRNGGGNEVTLTGYKLRGQLTDIFVEQGTVLEDGWNYSGDITLHEIDSEIWNKSLNFGYDNAFPTGKSKYVLAIDNKRNDNMINPEKDGVYGIAVLDNRVVLLGAY